MILKFENVQNRVLTTIFKSGLKIRFQISNRFSKAHLKMDFKTRFQKFEFGFKTGFQNLKHVCQQEACQNILTKKKHFNQKKINKKKTRCKKVVKTTSASTKNINFASNLHFFDESFIYFFFVFLPLNRAAVSMQIKVPGRKLEEEG